MTSDIDSRLKKLEELVIEKPHAIGKLSGVPFIVFHYEPSKELRIEKKISGFIEKLEFNEINVQTIDMREKFFSTLKNKNILNEVIEVEREDKYEELADGLRSVFFEPHGKNKGALIEEILADCEEYDAAVMVRTSILYPFTRISAIFSQLENLIDIPFIVFYPAEKDDKSLRFLKENEGTYYKAKVI